MHTKEILKGEKHPPEPYGALEDRSHAKKQGSWAYWIQINGR